ncbi:hypothetical protein TEA_009207 [Camellia sinensis var. sinensis]|uniref:Kri1-like C-terminal domain-containing protein n=1 Tax=Camellia sinensis var. sinensis TaxID=542762 RepID=A0A4S4EZA9_CAMSN|nr:hypothetical protein TEA_009207 [Camellia sinensis var. sinensis]
MREKLRKIRDTAGIDENWVCPLDEDDLEEEFDPKEHDRKMKEAFNDDYYDADDADPEFGSDRDEDGDEFEKPDFDKEDELLGLPKGWDDTSISGDGFLAARERNLKRRAENEGLHEQIEEEVPEEDKRKKKPKMSKLEKEILDKELEEYYKLDYEDTVGDLKTRFKYRDVGAKRYGLTTEEILMLDEKELNQYVSLKKLAPYREKEWKVPRNQVLNQKQRNKLLLQGNILNDKKIGKNLKIDDKKSTTVAVYKEQEKAKVKESNGDMSNLSRRSKRRHRQAELKLSTSRLMAYGKIPSKSKSVVKSKRSIWRLRTITDFFWAIVNFIGVFFATMFSMEKSDAYKKGSASGKKWDGGGPGGPGSGGPYGGGPRGPPRGLDNVRGIDHSSLPACGSCCG